MNRNCCLPDFHSSNQQVIELLLGSLFFRGIWGRISLIIDLISMKNIPLFVDVSGATELNCTSYLHVKSEAFLVENMKLIAPFYSKEH